MERKKDATIKHDQNKTEQEYSLVIRNKKAKPLTRVKVLWNFAMHPAIIVIGVRR